jgi:hypothetical protein
MQLGGMFIINCNNKHTAKLQHVGSLYILTYDAGRIKHKKSKMFLIFPNQLTTKLLE